MLTNQQENIKSSLFNAILKWHNDNEEEIYTAMDTAFGEFVTKLMSESAFNILLAQMDMTRYHEKEQTNFSE